MFSDSVKQLIIDSIYGDMNAFHEFRNHCRSTHYYVDQDDSRFMEKLPNIISHRDFFDSASTGHAIKLEFLRIALAQNNWNSCPLDVLMYLYLILTTTRLNASQLEQCQVLFREGFVHDYKNGVYDSRFLYILSLTQLCVMPVFSEAECRLIRRLLPISGNMTKQSAAIINCFQHDKLKLPIHRSIADLESLADDFNIDAIIQLINFYLWKTKAVINIHYIQKIIHWLDIVAFHRDDFSHYNNHQYLIIRFMIEKQKSSWPLELANKLPDITAYDITMLIEHVQFDCSKALFEALKYYIESAYLEDEFDQHFKETLKNFIKKHKQQIVFIDPEQAQTPSLDPKTFLTRHPGILQNSTKEKNETKRKFTEYLQCSEPSLSNEFPLMKTVKTQRQGQKHREHNKHGPRLKRTESYLSLQGMFQSSEHQSNDESPKEVATQRGQTSLFNQE